MIKLIITASGYVESNHMAKLFWRFQGPWEGKGDVTEALSPKKALHSLANEIACEYRREALQSPRLYGSHYGHNVDFRDLSISKCLQCNKPIRVPFVPEEFQQWLKDFTSSTAAENFAFNEIPHWWPWDSYAQIYNWKIKPKETLLVEENFDAFAAACIAPDDTFSADEREGIIEYTEDNLFKIYRADDGFWRAERVFDEEEMKDCVNNIDEKFLKEHKLKNVLK